MSRTSSVVPVRVVKAIPAVIDTNQSRDYIALQSVGNNSYLPTTANSYASNFVTWSVNNSKRVRLRLNLKAVYTVALTFNSDVNLAGNVLAGYEGLRAFPIAAMSATQSFQLDTTSFTNPNPAETIHAMSHYLQKRQIVPQAENCYPQMSDQFFDLYPDPSYTGNARNPFAPYSDSSSLITMTRNAYNFQWAATGNANEYQVVFCENIMVSPNHYNEAEAEDTTGVFGFDNLTVQVNLNNYLNRWWESGVSGRTVTAMRFVTAPVLLVNFVAPPEQTVLQDVGVWPLFEFNVITSNNNQSTIAPGASGTFLTSSQNVAAIPSALLSYVKDPPGIYYNSCNLTDTFWPFESFQVVWDNIPQLTTATPYDLYSIAQKNHCDIQGVQWFGQAVPNSSPINVGIGSPLLVKFGTDIYLKQNEAPGVGGNWPLYIQSTNTNPHGNSRSGQIYCLVIKEGTLTYVADTWTKNFGNLTTLEVQRAPIVGNTRELFRNDVGGSAFTEFVGRALDKVKTFVRGALPVVQSVASGIASVVPDARIRAIASGISAATAGLRQLIGAGRMRGGANLNPEQLDYQTQEIEKIDTLIQEASQLLEQVDCSDADKDEIYKAIEEYDKVKNSIPKPTNTYQQRAQRPQGGAALNRNQLLL